MKSLLEEAKLVTQVSDRLQNKLNRLNENINQKNIELQNTIDELTKARLGRKAATITLFVAVFLFILSELILEPFIEHLTSSIWIIIGSKGFLALLLKPFENFVEHYLQQKAILNKKNIK